MKTSGDVKYLVNVRDGDRWTIYTDAQTKGTGIKEAKALLQTGKFDAVKVTEDRGQVREINVFEEEAGSRPQINLSVTPIDEAPFCEELEAFYLFNARIALGRMLRQHLDHHGLTATEVIHDVANIREITQNETFFVQLLQTAASLQSKGRDQSRLARIEFLESIAEQMTERAESASDFIDYSEVLEKKHLGELIKQVEEKLDPRDQSFAINSLLARYLSTKLDWEGKLILLLDQIEKDPGDKAMVYLDELLAEIFDGSEAVQEILGYQRNLAAAMMTLIQLAAGTYEISEGSHSSLERLSAVMAKYDLKELQAILLERVGKALSGVNPLTKGERQEEQDAFRDLMRVLIGKKVFSNSGQLAEAATLRAKSVLKEEGEDESYQKAIDDMIFLLPNIATKFGYLLDLTPTEYGRKFQQHIIASLSNVLAGINSVTQIVGQGASEKQMIIAAAGMRDRLLETELPEEWRLRFARKIYDLLMAYKTGDSDTTISKTPEVMRQKAEENYNQTETRPEFKVRQKERASQSKAPELNNSASKNDNSLSRRVLQPGEYIFHEGEAGDEAYILLSGQVNIIRKVVDEEIVVAQVGAGSIIGEMALIDSEPRMASARALDETVLSIIPSKDLTARLERLEKTDPVMRRLVGMFVQRMRDSRIVSMDS